MNTSGAYTTAIEQRMRWLRWAKDVAAGKFRGTSVANALPMYERVLEAGDTFYMNKPFCDLVDHARRTVPDNLEFDPMWLQSQQGFLWLETHFAVPPISKHPEIAAVKLQIRAIGWFQIPAGTEVTTSEGIKVVRGEHSIEIVCFQDFQAINPDAQGFGCWSYFTLVPGHRCLDRIHAFERLAVDTDEGHYIKGRESDELHEIRWVYSALYLMAQKLATTVSKTDRPLRRRMEREKHPPEFPPMVRIITLRRLEIARERAEAGMARHVDWQWQWDVRGHWRNQYIPGSDERRPVFIESYIKGPADKPLKPPGHKLFIGKR